VHRIYHRIFAKNDLWALTVGEERGIKTGAEEWFGKIKEPAPGGKENVWRHRSIQTGTSSSRGIRRTKKEGGIRKEKV